MRQDTSLSVLVTSADGHSKTFESNASSAGERPRGIQFSTQLGTGFYTGGFTLSWPIDRDNTDIHPLDDVKFIGGASGDVAYEGFVGELPRTMDRDGHTLSVSTAGWMGHATDRPFTAIFVDRDLSQWHEVGRTRMAALVASFTVNGPQVIPDATNGMAALVLQHADQWSTPRQPLAEAWYDAGPGNGIGRIYYDIVNAGNASTGDTNWRLQVFTSTDDAASSIPASSANLWPSGLTAGAITDTSASGSRYAAVQYYYNTTPGGGQGYTYSVHFRKLAVYGNHGLTRYGDAEPYGVRASDVIKWIAARYCPLLNTSGVQQTTYPIAQLTFRDDTTPYDAFLKVNSYHLWGLAVWENRILTYKPIDLTDWDWEVRHDEIGATIDLQGDSIENLRNGIVVQYTNVATGSVEKLLPSEHFELRDDSIDNPANQAGRSFYGPPFVIPFPTTQADALELGRIKLLEDGQAKAPGSFTVEGHIRDRAGTWQPAWKVRAGDRVRLTSSLNLSDRPRLIHETSYDHSSRTVTIGVDSTIRSVEAFFDRVQASLAAVGLEG